jgi:hypothetical protein
MRFGKNTFRNQTLFAAIFLASFAVSGKIAAQESWSLQRCIEYARTNSLSLKQAGYGIANAKLTDK